MVQAICSVATCDRPVHTKALGLCLPHEKRLERTGDLRPETPVGHRPSLSDRFWSKVAKTDSCWEWQGSKDRKGYGRIHLKGFPQLAHRVAYELLIGQIPEGLTLDHLCCNPPCVNPAHLEPVTNEENLRRWYSNIPACPKGHPYTEANTYRDPKHGHRRCRTCTRTHQRKMRLQREARKKEQANG